MIQVKKGHSSIDNVIKNTPTTLDMFLQTNFDKIKQNCNENHLFGTLQIFYSRSHVMNWSLKYGGVVSWFTFFLMCFTIF